MRSVRTNGHQAVNFLQAKNASAALSHPGLGNRSDGYMVGGRSAGGDVNACSILPELTGGQDGHGC